MNTPPITNCYEDDPDPSVEGLVPFSGTPQPQPELPQDMIGGHQ